MFGPLRWIVGFWDRIDNRRACELREAYGQRLRLLSWERDPDGRWGARLSGPGIERTIVRTGRSRFRAAEAASVAMDRLLFTRFTLRPHRDQPPDPTVHENSADCP